MTSLGFLCTLAALALGIWLVRADRDHAWRRPALPILAVLTFCAVTGWLWNSSYAPAPLRPAPAVAPTPAMESSSESVLERPSLGVAALLLAVAVAYTPSRRPAPRIVRVLMLSLLLYACLMVAGIHLFLAAMGVSTTPFHRWQLLLWGGTCLVCSLGLVRHGPYFRLPWGTDREYEPDSGSSDE